MWIRSDLGASFLTHVGGLVRVKLLARQHCPPHPEPQQLLEPQALPTRKPAAEPDKSCPPPPPRPSGMPCCCPQTIIPEPQSEAVSTTSDVGRVI